MHIFLMGFLVILLFSSLVIARSFLDNKMYTALCQHLSRELKVEMEDIYEIIVPTQHSSRVISVYIICIGIMAYGWILFEWYWGVAAILIATVILSPILILIFGKKLGPSEDVYQHRVKAEIAKSLKPELKSYELTKKLNTVIDGINIKSFGAR